MYQTYVVIDSEHNKVSMVRGYNVPDLQPGQQALPYYGDEIDIWKVEVVEDGDDLVVRTIDLTLNDFKNKVWEEVKAFRAIRGEALMTFGEVIVQIDGRSRYSIQSVARLARSSPEIFPLPFKVLDNSEIDLTAEQAILLEALVDQFDIALYNEAQRLRTLIYAAGSKEELDGIDIYGSWPN